MGKLEKRIERIMKLDTNLRFEDLANVLMKLGYTKNKPSGGSHYTFRKKGKQPITIPNDSPINIAYVEMVKDALIEEGF